MKYLKCFVLGNVGVAPARLVFNVERSPAEQGLEAAAKLASAEEAKAEVPLSAKAKEATDAGIAKMDKMLPEDKISKDWKKDGKEPGVDGDHYAPGKTFHIDRPGVNIRAASNMCVAKTLKEAGTQCVTTNDSIRECSGYSFIPVRFDGDPSTYYVATNYLQIDTPGKEKSSKPLYVTPAEKAHDVEHALEATIKATLEEGEKDAQGEWKKTWDQPFRDFESSGDIGQLTQLYKEQFGGDLLTLSDQFRQDQPAAPERPATSPAQEQPVVSAAEAAAATPAPAEPAPTAPPVEVEKTPLDEYLSSGLPSGDELARREREKSAGNS